MTLSPLGPNRPLPPAAATPSSSPSSTDDTPAAPADEVKFFVDDSAPHRRLVIPHNTPIDRHPVSGSKKARGLIAGTVVGGMSGSFFSMQLMALSPVAGLTAVIGGAVVGGVMGYLATKG